MARRWAAWAYQGGDLGEHLDLQELQHVVQVAADDGNVRGVLGQIVDPADGLFHAPLDGPHAAPSQSPRLGGQATPRGESALVAAYGDVLLQEDPQPDEARCVGGAVV